MQPPNNRYTRQTYNILHSNPTKVGSDGTCFFPASSSAEASCTPSDSHQRDQSTSPGGSAKRLQVWVCGWTCGWEDGWIGGWVGEWVGICARYAFMQREETRKRESVCVRVCERGRQASRETADHVTRILHIMVCLSQAMHRIAWCRATRNESGRT